MSESATYTVTGMTCEHCVASVTEEVLQVSGVDQVNVVLETGTLTVAADEPIDDDAIKAAVQEAGYQVAPEPRP